MSFKKCCAYCLSDWHYSKFSFTHHDWTVFVYTPWLPYKWDFQLIYIAYRWILSFYFFAWLIVSGLQACASKYLIYMTNWGFILFNIYLTIAALSATTKYILVQLGNDYHQMRSDEDETFQNRSVLKLFASESNKISWYQSIHWFSCVIGTELVIGACILFWILAYDQETWDASGIHTHIISGTIAWLDFWICGIPVNTYHVLYLMLCGAAYFIFTGVYYTRFGEIIYPALDYDINIPVAIAVSLLAVFVGIPIIHFLFYLQHKLKVGIISHFNPRLFSKN